MWWPLALLPFCLLHQAAEVAAEEAPQITLRPRDQQAKAGGIVAFTCAASGVPQPALHWKRNGKRVLSEKTRYEIHTLPQGGSLLLIDPVRAPRDNSRVECVAENGVGDVATAGANLVVYEEDKVPEGFPQITQAPSTTVVEIGHTGVIQCSATGSPPPSISWVRDRLPVDTVGNPRYTILDKGALQITGSVEDDQGKYACVAENTVGTAYSQAMMFYAKVRRVPPQFSTTPEPLYEVKPGDSLDVPCEATGAPVPSVKWRKNPATDLTPEDKQPTGKNVLELRNIQESANYTCVATSVLGVIEAVTQVKVQ